MNTHGNVISQLADLEARLTPWEHLTAIETLVLLREERSVALAAPGAGRVIISGPSKETVAFAPAVGRENLGMPVCFTLLAHELIRTLLAVVLASTALLAVLVKIVSFFALITNAGD